MPYPRQCPARRDGTGRQEKMTIVARYPDSTKTSLEQRLRARARERWPQIASLQIRHRGVFSYVDATLADATTLKLCRLRYVGSASQWQFAIYRASHDDYDESVFFTGLPVGTCQDALDTACGLYLDDPTAWTRHPTNLRARPLSLGRLARLISAPAQSGFTRPLIHLRDWADKHLPRSSQHNDERQIVRSFPPIGSSQRPSIA